jgi:hypothetical protein
MAIEKSWEQFGPVLITADGGSEGQIQIADTCGLYVKQRVILTSDAGIGTQKIEIKRITSSTTIEVGLVGQNIRHRLDVSAFLVADNAQIRADEQPKTNLQPDDFLHAIYAHEPIVAVRTIMTDCYGDFYTKDNPLPVEATIVMETPNAPTIVKLDIPAAGNEVSTIFPSGTKKVLIRPRTPRNQEIRYAWGVGNIANDLYMSIRPGNSEVIENPNNIIYFTAQKNNTILEIQYWT